MIQRVFLFSLTVTFFLFSGCSSSPGTGDSWQSLGGPYARDVATVIADPSRPGIVYAALTTGEILRSVNNGTTWDPLASFGRGVLPYRFLASVDTPVVFLGATDAGLFVASANRRQWRKLLLGDLPPNTGAHTVAIDPWKPSTWYAGTDGHGISYKSTDAGTTCARLEWNIDRPFRVHGRGSCDRRSPAPTASWRQPTAWDLWNRPTGELNGPG